jgi:hypothetical protein
MSNLHRYTDTDVEFRCYGKNLYLTVDAGALRPETAAIVRFGELSFWHEFDRDSAAALIAQLWLVSTGKNDLPALVNSVEIGHESWTFQVQASPTGLALRAEQAYAKDPCIMETELDLLACAELLSTLLVFIATPQ